MHGHSAKAGLQSIHHIIPTKTRLQTQTLLASHIPSAEWQRTGLAPAVCTFIALIWPLSPLLLTYRDYHIAEPHDEELMESPIERGLMRKLLQQGNNLLNVHEDQFEHSVRHQIVKKALAEAYSPEKRVVKSLPLAAERYKANMDYITWSGADTVLGDSIFAKDSKWRNRFRLLPEVLVVKLISDEKTPGKIANAVIRNLRTGNERNISAKVGRLY